MLWIQWAAVLGLVASGTAIPEGGALDSGQVAPITTRQTFFAIPFQVSGGAPPGTEPAEVQLFV
jgi:hypothetical protein